MFSLTLRRTLPPSRGDACFRRLEGEGLNAFLTNPAVQTAFGGLFDAAPTVTVKVAPSGFLTWGALSPKPGSYLVSVRGTFKGATWNANEAAHNQVAGGGPA